jgi:hypothetical protein
MIEYFLQSLYRCEPFMAMHLLECMIRDLDRESLSVMLTMIDLTGMDSQVVDFLRRELLPLRSIPAVNEFLNDRIRSMEDGRPSGLGLD